MWNNNFVAQAKAPVVDITIKLSVRWSDGWHLVETQQDLRNERYSVSPGDEAKAYNSFARQTRRIVHCTGCSDEKVHCILSKVEYRRLMGKKVPNVGCHLCGTASYFTDQPATQPLVFSFNRSRMRVAYMRFTVYPHFAILSIVLHPKVTHTHAN